MKYLFDHSRYDRRFFLRLLSAQIGHVDAQNGWLELSPAYAYTGIKGSTSQGTMNLPNVTQQAGQMGDFAMAIINDRPSPVPGEMGMQDLKILKAIYRAMETGQRIMIENE